MMSETSCIHQINKLSLEKSRLNLCVFHVNDFSLQLPVDLTNYRHPPSHENHQDVFLIYHAYIFLISADNKMKFQFKHIKQENI